MTDNQTKCGIIYEKIAMRAGNDERMINYEWPIHTGIQTADMCNMSINFSNILPKECISFKMHQFSLFS